jgi:lambda repressor-like predicted transcriptional regulator
MHLDTGIDERVIRERLRQAGVELEKRSSREDLTVPMSRLVELYEAGWSLADLAVQSGGSYGMVRRVLLEAGVQFRMRGGRS